MLFYILKEIQAMNETIMVLGGSSSGKSTYAETLTKELACKYSAPVYYLATGTIWDDEFARKVEKHRQRRPSSWQTIEEAHDLAGVLKNIKGNFSVILLDGVGTWLSNLMYQRGAENFTWDKELEASCLQSVQDFINCWEELDASIIMVADEVGMEIVSEYYQARVFRDLNGQVNQMLARNASAVYFVVAGIPVCLKGEGPV
jgi:adenosylcobinamide kinase/adenosylcobinamide-phosphate guanylyltransferase